MLLGLTLAVFLVVVHHAFVVLVVVAEPLVQVLTAVVSLVAGARTALRSVLLSLPVRAARAALLGRVTPAARRLSRVHLTEQQAQHSLTVFPVEVRQLDRHPLVGRQQRSALLLLALLKVSLLAVLAARVDQRQELGRFGSLDLGHVLLEFQAFLLFDLLHRLKEELFDVRSLIKDHLANSPDIFKLSVFDPRSLGQVPELLRLLLDDLLVLELQKLALFLKVRHDLAKGLLKQINLGLEHLDFLLFFELAF